MNPGTLPQQSKLLKKMKIGSWQVEEDLPIKKALNLAFPLAISNKMLSDTFIFGVGTLRNRLFVIILSISLISKRLDVAKHVTTTQCHFDCIKNGKENL